MRGALGVMLECGWCEHGADSYGNLPRLTSFPQGRTEQYFEPIAHGHGAVSGVGFRCLTVVGIIAEVSMCAG